MPTVSRPPKGNLYHGVFPGKHDGKGDDVWPEDLAAYEAAVKRKVAWVYFSNEWSRCRLFPRDKVEWIRKRKAIPFIRLMLRSFLEGAEKTGCGKEVYSLEAILHGDFDDSLKEWAQDAKAYAGPLLVEYGTECNVQSFCWNGLYHGNGHKSDPLQPHGDGPTAFIKAYRYIVEFIRRSGATNITWVFHMDADDSPGDAWNNFLEYYPGDDVVDWIGVSCYGAQLPFCSDPVKPFIDKITFVYRELKKIVAPSKPIVIAEFGCVNCPPLHIEAHSWADEALAAILSRAGKEWKDLIGFSWWNESWRNVWDDDPHDPKTDSNMLVQENLELAKVFQQRLKNPKVLETALVSARS